MKITNEFTVHTTLDKAWEVLTDLPGIAPCLPGAQLTGVDGDEYKGKVRVKVGPVISDFSGTAKFVEKDDDAHRAVIDAKGRDSRAGGNAAAIITARLRPDGDATVVSVDTDLKISGKLAQFGSGMIKEVSGKLLGQFVESLEAKIGASDATTSSPSDAPPPAAGSPPPAAGSPPPAAGSPPATAGSTPPAAGSPPATAGSTPPAAGSTPATAGSTSAAPPPEALPEAPPPGAPPAKPAEAAFDTARPAVPATAATGGRAAGVEAYPRNGAVVRASAEPAPLDLMAVAGSSIRKRLIPVAAGVVVVVAAVVIWRLVGR